MAYEIYDLTNIAGTGTLNGDLFEPTTWNGEIYALELGCSALLNQLLNQLLIRNCDITWVHVGAIAHFWFFIKNNFF